jgi:hypothetical protein
MFSTELLELAMGLTKDSAPIRLVSLMTRWKVTCGPWRTFVTEYRRMEHCRRLSKGVDIRGLCIFEVEMTVIDGLVQRAPPTLDLTAQAGDLTPKSQRYM